MVLRYVCDYHNCNNSEPILRCASWYKVLDKDVCSRKMRVPVEFTYTMCYWQNKHTLYLYCYSSSIKDLKKKKNLHLGSSLSYWNLFSFYLCLTSHVEPGLGLQRNWNHPWKSGSEQTLSWPVGAGKATWMVF